MPPKRGRGRPRKRKTTLEIEPAVDAMVAMGFEEGFVRETVDELLQLYSEEGWELVEENSYEVLRERLLEKQAEIDKQQEGPLMIAESSAGPSTLLLPPCSGAWDVQEVEMITGPSTVPLLPPFSSAGGIQEETHANDASKYSAVITQGSETSLQDHEIGDEVMASDCDSSYNRPGSAIRSKKPYKPCYGWISADDEEITEDDIITLEPMPLEEFRKMCFFRQEYQPREKRKSRWDVGPDSISSR